MTASLNEDILKRYGSLEYFRGRFNYHLKYSGEKADSDKSVTRRVSEYRRIFW